MSKAKSSKQMKDFKKFIRSRNTIIFLVIFGLLGTFLLLTSRAATPNASVTSANTTTVQLPARVVDDSTAVGGKALLFPGSSINGDRLGISPGEPYLSDGVTNATYMAKTAQLGVKWVRLDANLYKSVNFIDNAMSEAKMNNLKVLPVFTYGDTSTSANRTALANKVRDYVVHWNDLGLLSTVGAYELWNEPNNTGDASIGYVAPDRMADFMRKAYPILKFASPNLTVIAGGYAPGGGNAPCCNGQDMNPADYLDRLYKANGNSSDNMFDAAAIHPYDSSNYPYAGDHPQSGWRNPHHIRQVMNSYGDSDKKLWATEAGWYSCGGGGSNPAGFNEAERSTRFKNDMKDWFYGLHNADGSPKNEYNPAGGDWNTGPFIIFKLYKNPLNSDADSLGLIYTPSRTCDGQPAWYEPPIVGDIKLFSLTSQSVVNPTW